MAETRANKGKHTKPRHYKAAAINLESPELPAAIVKIRSGIKGYCDAREKHLTGVRETVTKMVQCGLLLGYAQQHINRDDWINWLRRNFPKLSYENAKRCMRLARQRASIKPMTYRQALYQCCRFGGYDHEQANKITFSTMSLFQGHNLTVNIGGG
jgi:hypothetical protein